MIGVLKGEVALRRPDHVVLLCGGVGYRAAVSAQTLQQVPAAGEQTMLHTHLIVRDDALTLYGFHSEQERELFLMLLSVQAVGPKVALSVLSGGSARELIGAIAAGDAARFQTVPGIGKRTAERIIVELRERVLGAHEALGDGQILARRGEGPRGLAREGLLELGYGPGEVEQMLSSATGESAEELIAQALRAARGAVVER
jgi:holliday junction DNA helicase RuvA